MNLNIVQLTVWDITKQKNSTNEKIRGDMHVQWMNDHWEKGDACTMNEWSLGEKNGEEKL